MMTDIHLTIQYTPEDLQRGYTLHMQKRKPVRSRLLLILGAALILIGFILMALNYLRPDDGFFFLFLRWLFISYGIAVVLFYFWSVRNIGKRIFKKLPDFAFPFTYHITETGISAKGKNIESMVEWGHYRYFVIADDFVLLYPNDLRFYLFPKKYFSGNDFETFVKLIRDKVDS
jgi:hypothetical protein